MENNKEKKEKIGFRKTPPRIVRCNMWVLVLSIIILGTVLIITNMKLYGGEIGQGEVEIFDILLYSIGQVALCSTAVILAYQVSFWITKGICFAISKKKELKPVLTNFIAVVVGLVSCVTPMLIILLRDSVSVE